MSNYIHNTKSEIRQACFDADKASQATRIRGAVRIANESAVYSSRKPRDMIQSVFAPLTAWTSTTYLHPRDLVIVNMATQIRMIAVSIYP